MKFNIEGSFSVSIIRYFAFEGLTKYFLTLWINSGQGEYIYKNGQGGIYYVVHERVKKSLCRVEVQKGTDLQMMKQKKD